MQQQPGKFRFHPHRGPLILLILYVIALFTATHLPPRDLPTVHVSDKIEHLTAFTILAGLLLLVLHRNFASDGQHDWLALVIIMIYAAVDEWTQILVGRDCELSDWTADVAGAAVIVVLFGIFRYFFLKPRNRTHQAHPDHTPNP